MTADNQSRRRAIASLSTAQRLQLEALFTEKPDAKVAIVSASPGHSIACAAARLNPALAREAANREAQEARDRWWAELFRHDGEPRPAVYARSVHREPVPIHRQAPGTAPWPPEFIYDDIVPSAPAPTWRDLQLGAVPGLSPCTMPPRPAVTITIER